jgi:hypothetical protein
MSAITAYTYNTAPTLELTVGENIGILQPTLAPSQTGVTLSYSVSPDLPPGLLLNNSSGTLSGIPTQISIATSYAFSVTNSDGTFTIYITISISDECPALECGCGQGYFSELVQGVTVENDYLGTQAGDPLTISNYTGSGFLQVDGDLLELN